MAAIGTLHFVQIAKEVLAVVTILGEEEGEAAEGVVEHATRYDPSALWCYHADIRL